MTPESRQSLVAWQLRVEREDGPRWAECLRGGRDMTLRLARSKWGRVDGARYSYPLERAIHGIPEGWITR